MFQSPPRPRTPREAFPVTAAARGFHYCEPGVFFPWLQPPGERKGGGDELEVSALCPSPPTSPRRGLPQSLLSLPPPHQQGREIIKKRPLVLHVLNFIPIVRQNASSPRRPPPLSDEIINKNDSCVGGGRGHPESDREVFPGACGETRVKTTDPHTLRMQAGGPRAPKRLTTGTGNVTKELRHGRPVSQIIGQAVQSSRFLLCRGQTRPNVVTLQPTGGLREGWVSR